MAKGRKERIKLKNQRNELVLKERINKNNPSYRQSRLE
jgi:hypothetical protein